MSPRTLDYLILRVCERLHLKEDEFYELDYHVQIQRLAYEQIRQHEEAFALTR
jgi:hypothetical protein